MPILDSKSLTYTTTTGSIDKIKLDINYHSRCHVYPAVRSYVTMPFGVINIPMQVTHVDVIELFAGKIKAFYERCKPRDIFDIYSLAKSGLLLGKEERDALRKCVVFYSVLGNTDRPDILKQDLNGIRKMPFQAFKTQLLPMLHTQMGHFDKDGLVDIVVGYLESLMILNDNENEFIDRFFKGDFRPALLFDETTSNILKLHPMILRTLQMLDISH